MKPRRPLLLLNRPATIFRERWRGPARYDAPGAFAEASGSGQDILVATASLRKKWQNPLGSLTPAQVTRFARALRTRLLDPSSGFGKAYLNLLIDEIRLDGDELRIQGSYGALARAVSLSKEGKLDKVPSFVPVWHPGDESNVRPAP